MKQAYIAGGIIVVLIIVVSMCVGYNLRKPTTVYVDVPFTTHDTTYVDKHVTIVKWLPAKHDTTIKIVYRKGKATDREDRDSLIIQPTFQDSIKQDGVYYGFLQVSYFPAPWYAFDYKFTAAPQMQVTITKYVYKPRHWYQSQWLAGAVGLAAGIATERIR